MKKFNSLEKAVKTMESGKKVNGKLYPLTEFKFMNETYSI